VIDTRTTTARPAAAGPAAAGPEPPGPEPAAALRAAVGDALRDLIVTGEIPPGARLVERTLADRLGVSRVPVREALRDLEAQGYAITRPTRGIQVREYSAAEVDELFEIRAALEAILLRRAAGGVSPDAAERLRACLAATAADLAAGDAAAAVAGNARFHEVLTEVAAGPLLHNLLAGLGERMRWLLTRHGDPATIHAEHVALLDAVLAGDLAAVERLEVQHLSTSRIALDRRRATARPGGPAAS
jgi:DNA-binding GntR family transcriptional regulator